MTHVLLASLLIAVLLISCTVTYFLRLVYLKELDKFEVEKSYLKNIIKNKEKYYNEYISVQKYASLVEKSKNDALSWDIVLTVFSQTIPQGIWFDSIDLVYDGKTATCSIKGKATDKTVIIQWLVDVEKREY